MIEENRAKFFTVSLRVPVEQGLSQGYKGLIVISLAKYAVKFWPTKSSLRCNSANSLHVICRIEVQLKKTRHTFPPFEFK